MRIRRSEEGKKEEKAVEIWKIPKPQMVAFLIPREMNRLLIRALHVLWQIRSEPSLQIIGTHLERHVL